jgi:large subunit ribosomal protein L35e
MVKAYELRGLPKEELLKTLAENRKLLAELHVAKVTGGARVLTVHNQQQKEGIRKAAAGSKYISKDLRVKTTRAMRRALTKEQKGAKTLKQKKKDTHFPMRRYAVKA